ncbi:hypothetical protein BWQ27_25740 [Salmonella enterica subsp. enterica serovar Pensacola]|uniref:Uncharacterized protein n=1 Tax=Salmonella enterica subsp. enterica serovar Pensacola TaxID=34042 RepID=A0A602ZAR4_SALET|nr:hypothetical protein [Salmonella enterica subsp. enterica serovar Pensacola]
MTISDESTNVRGATGAKTAPNHALRAGIGLKKWMPGLQTTGTEGTRRKQREMHLLNGATCGVGEKSSGRQGVRIPPGLIG